MIQWEEQIWKLDDSKPIFLPLTKIFYQIGVYRFLMLLIYFYQLNPYLILSYFLYYPPVKDNLLTQVLSSPGDYEDIQDRLTQWYNQYPKTALRQNWSAKKNNKDNKYYGR